MKARRRLMITIRRDNKTDYENQNISKQETENRRRKMKVIVKENKLCIVNRTYKLEGASL